MELLAKKSNMIENETLKKAILSQGEKIGGQTVPTYNQTYYQYIYNQIIW